MSAVNDVSNRRVKDMAANGMGSPAVFDPLPGIPFIPSDPFFLRKLRFVSSMDRAGRVRFTALTTE